MLIPPAACSHSNWLLTWCWLYSREFIIILSSSFVVLQDLDLRELLHGFLPRRDSIKILVENQSCKYLLFAGKERLFDNVGQFWCDERFFFPGIRKVHFGCKRYFWGVGKSDLRKQRMPLCQSGSIWVSWWWWCSAGPANWGHLILLIVSLSSFLSLSL